MRHLLVTNDFPPKVGGIQSYLWELWRRLPPHDTTVLTTSRPGDVEFDVQQPFRVVRSRSRVLLPTPAMRRAVDRLAADVGAGLVVLDPALPLGLVGPRLERPYAVVAHGAEIAVPGRLPGTHAVLASVLRGAAHVIAAGTYPAAEARRAAGRDLPTTVVPPGVDATRFRPLDPDERRASRAAVGLPVGGPLVVSVSRLVPRKGMDTLIEAAARLAPDHPGLIVAVAGAGRDRGRLERLARRSGSPVRFLGRVPAADLPRVHGMADLFVMACRSRWGGLEQEGFGIVFLEAAACGVAQVAGDTGGAAEAVLDGETGIVVRRPKDAGALATAIGGLLDDEALRARMGLAARQRAASSFAYDTLAARLRSGLEGLGRS